MKTAQKKLIFVQGLPVPDGYSSGVALVWWLKLGIKLILSRLRISIPTLQKLGGFRNSPKSNDFEREISGLMQVWQKYQEQTEGAGPTFLEVGVGDSVCRALIASSLGARKIYLVDHRDTANLDVEHYRQVDQALVKRGLPSVLKGHEQSRADILQSVNACFLTDGLASLRSIELNSIDIIVTAAVLEHIPLAQFDEFFDVFYEIGKADSLSFHGIDFHDHFRGKLNHLRFSNKIWEGKFGINSGFYTNRIGRSDMFFRIEGAGFFIEEIERFEWKNSPIVSEKIHEDLSWSIHDLLVCSATIFCHKKPQ